MTKTKVVHCRREKYDIYIGRGSKWGNPYTHLSLCDTKAQFQVATREEAVEKYREYIMGDVNLFAALPELQGKVLGCFCKPQACHGDILAELADKYSHFIKVIKLTEIEQVRQVMLGNKESGYHQVPCMCIVCHLNEVDAAGLVDTCEECLRKG